MQSVLIAAIEGRRLVSFWYDPGVRVVEPHALGYGSDGQLLLRAFQIEGASELRIAINQDQGCIHHTVSALILSYSP